jgi:hypothetical protein
MENGVENAGEELLFAFQFSRLPSSRWTWLILLRLSLCSLQKLEAEGTIKSSASWPKSHNASLNIPAAVGWGRSSLWLSYHFCRFWMLELSSHFQRVQQQGSRSHQPEVKTKGHVNVGQIRDGDRGWPCDSVSYLEEINRWVSRTQCIHKWGNLTALLIWRRHEMDNWNTCFI